jgi:AcrR family transcriptional regulator
VKRPAADSRNAILAAATTEFAARGFDGASVDDIARRSGLNKAMIYYHFKSKQGVYLEILREMFRALGARTRTIVESDETPARKIEAFIDALNAEAVARTHFPPMMMREMADGARRLDRDTLGLMAALFGNLSAILAQGAAAGVFRPTNPVLTYFTLIAPVIFFRATAPVRQALQKHRLVDAPAFDPDAFIAYLKTGALTVLTTGASCPLAAPRSAAGPVGTVATTTTRRRRTSRSGDHA